MRKTFKRKTKKNRTHKGGGPFNKIKKIFSRKKLQQPIFKNNNGIKNILNEPTTNKPALIMPSNGEPPPRENSKDNIRRKELVFGSIKKEPYMSLANKHRKNMGWRYDPNEAFPLKVKPPNRESPNRKPPNWS